MLIQAAILVNILPALIEHPLVTITGDNANTLVQVTYEGYPRGSKRVTKVSALSEAHDKATLSFDVKFCENFDFARGGKLHGLGSARPITGGEPMDGENWSARLMWRDGGSLRSYVYHQAKDGVFGDFVRHPGFSFQPGIFYRMQMAVQLNSEPSKEDGTVRVWVDDKLLIEHKGIQFYSRESPANDIQTFLFNTFHGGSDPSWAPRTATGDFKNDCAYFKNFTVRSTSERSPE